MIIGAIEEQDFSEVDDLFNLSPSTTPSEEDEFADMDDFLGITPQQVHPTEEDEFSSIDAELGLSEEEDEFKDIDEQLGIEPLAEEKPGLFKGLISGAKDLFGKVFPKYAGTPPEQEAFEQEFSPTGEPVPPEYMESLESVSELPDYSKEGPYLPMSESERIEFEKTYAKPRIPYEHPVTIEDKQRLVKTLIASGDEDLLGKIIQTSAAFGKGALFGIDIPGEGDIAGEVLMEEKPLATTAGAITSTIAQAIGGGTLVGGVLSKTAIGKASMAKSGLVLDLLTRMTTGAGVIASKQDWEKNFDEALVNTLQGVGMAAVSVIPEIYAPPAWWSQIPSQVIAGALFDVGVDAARGKAQQAWSNPETRIQYLQEKAVNGFMDAGFAIRDVASGATFVAGQGAKRAAIAKVFKGRGSKGFEVVKAPEGLQVREGKVEKIIEAHKAIEKAKEAPTKQIPSEKEGEFDILYTKEGVPVQMGKGYKPTSEEIGKLPEPVEGEMKPVEALEGAEVSKVVSEGEPVKETGASAPEVAKKAPTQEVAQLFKNIPPDDNRGEWNAINEYLVKNEPTGKVGPTEFLPSRDEEFARIVNTGKYDSPESTINPLVEDARAAIIIGEKLGYKKEDIAAYLQRNYIDRPYEVDKLTDKEYIDKYGEPKPTPTTRKPIHKRGQYSELSREDVEQAYSDINKEFKSAEKVRQTGESAIEGEIPATKLGSELRKTLQKEFSGNQWRNLIGGATRDSQGKLIKYSADVQKRLDEIAEGWNTERIEGTLDPKDPLSRLLHSSENVDKVWQANDVQDVIMGGKNVKAFEAYASDVEGRRSQIDKEYEGAIDVLDKKMAELDSRAEELGVDLRPGAEEFDFGPTEEALFLTGKKETMAGAVTVPTPGKGLGQRIKTSPFVKKFKEWFVADKGIPNSIVRERVKRTGKLVNFGREVESDITNLWEGMKESYGRRWNKLTDKEEFKLNQALANPSKIKTLPENLQGLVKHFRAKVDGLSKMLIDEGLATGELAAALKRREGIYFHRQYRLHKDKKWRNKMLNVREGDKIAYELRGRTKNFLYNQIAENPKEFSKLFGAKTEKEIDAILEGKVDELLQIEDSPIQIFTGDTELSKEVMSIFKKRKDIPAEIRALWGEYKVLDFNYAQTVLKQAKMLENYRMFKNIRENNLGTFFHEGNPIVKDGVSYSKKIDAGNNPALKPLDGLYTTKEIYDEMLNMDKNTPLPWWARQWMKGVALTKIGKTVLQSMTHMRNSQSNLFITNSMGNLYNTKVPGAAVKATKEIYHLMINKSDAELDGFLKGAIERGVVGESVNVGIIRDVVNDSQVETFDQFIGVRRGNLLRKVAKLPEKLYSAEDDTPKLFNYIMEIDTYKRAAEYDPKSIEKIFPETKFPDKSDPQFIEKVMDVAAEIIRSGMPTYSKIPKGIRELRRLPFRGSFVSFPYEMVRTTGNLIKLINKEMKSGNPVLQAKAAKRIVGLTTSTTLTSAVMGGAATAIYQGYKIAKEYLTGEEKKEGRKQFTEKEKKIIQKYMLPVWSRNADITLIEYKDGVYYYSDNSYTNPYAQQLNNPINAFMRGDDYKKGLLAATGEFFQPYMSEDIFTSLIVDLHRNKDQAGNEIWNESEDWDIQVVDALNHCMDKVEPGFIHAARRFYRALNEEKKGASGTIDDIDAEIMAQMTGVRISKCDPIVALKFAAYDFQKEKKNASRLSYRKDVATSYKLKKKIYDNFADHVNATVSLGFTKKKIYRALRGTGMTSGDILHIYAGTYEKILGAKRKKAEAMKGIKKKVWD